MISDLRPSSELANDEMMKEAPTRTPPPYFPIKDDTSLDEVDSRHSKENNEVDNDDYLHNSFSRINSPNSDFNRRIKSSLSEERDGRQEEGGGGVEFNGHSQMRHQNLFNEEDSKVVYSKHGIKWYEPSIGLWLWKQSDKYPANNGGSVKGTSSELQEHMLKSVSLKLETGRSPLSRLNSFNHDDHDMVVPLPSSPLLYYSQEASSWLPFTSHDDRGSIPDHLQTKENGRKLHYTEATRPIINKHDSFDSFNLQNENNLNLEAVALSPLSGHYKHTKIDNQFSAERHFERHFKVEGGGGMHYHPTHPVNNNNYGKLYDEQISTQIRLAKLDRIEKQEMIEKLIAEKELEMLEKELAQPKVQYHRDGLSFTTDMKDGDSDNSHDYLIMSKLKENDRKYFSAAACSHLYRHDSEFKPYTEKAMPRRTHVWCRESSDSESGLINNNFRPVHFNEKLFYDAVDHIPIGVEFEENKRHETSYVRKGEDRKQFIHGSFSFHPHKTNSTTKLDMYRAPHMEEEEEEGRDMPNEEHDKTTSRLMKKASIKHSRDFEWLGRSISVEKYYDFDYEDSVSRHREMG